MENKQRVKSIAKYEIPNLHGYKYYIPSMEHNMFLDPQYCQKFKTRKEAILWIHENYPEY